MTDRPIIFSAPMVRALLQGRKTQTRRVLKPQPVMSEVTAWIVPPYATGDRLWVREAWRPHYLGDDVWNLDVSYPADSERRTIMDGEFGDNDWNWPKAADRGNASPIYMPRWASRITLSVTDVRVQRLQDISEADAVAEGIEPLEGSKGPNFYTREMWRKGQVIASHNTPTAAECYRGLWEDLHGPDAWDTNPWVCALTFTVERKNIDA